MPQADHLALHAHVQAASILDTEAEAGVQEADTTTSTEQQPAPAAQVWIVNAAALSYHVQGFGHS